MDSQFTDICKIVVEHFKENRLFASDTKYFSSTQIHAILCQAALQKTSIEDKQKRKEDKTSPTAETVRNAIINHFDDFSRYEIGKYISSLLQTAAMSSLRYQKLRRGSLALMRLTLNMQERIFTFKRKTKRKKRLLSIIARSVSLCDFGGNPRRRASVNHRFSARASGSKTEGYRGNSAQICSGDALKTSSDFNGRRVCSDRIVSIFR